MKLNCAAIPASSSRASCSATRRARSPAPRSSGAASSSRRTAARCSSTRSATCRSARRPRCCACCRRARSSASAARETIKVDVRVVAATNKDLKSEIAQGALPRRPLLPARTWCRSSCRRCASAARTCRRSSSTSSRGVRRTTASASSPSPRAAMSLLMQHDWPGNVRELRNLVERLVILTGDATSSAKPTSASAAAASSRCARRSSAARRSRISSRRPSARSSLAALEANDHHVSNTARELGLERSHLYKKMRALGIDHRRRRRRSSRQLTRNLLRMRPCVDSLPSLRSY